MKSLFIAEVSFVLNTNTFSVTFTILFVLFQKAPDRCTVESENVWARVRTEPQPRPPAGDPQHPGADLLQALILIL